MPGPTSELLKGRTFERRTPRGTEVREITDRWGHLVYWRRASRDGRRNPTVYTSTEKGGRTE